MGYGQPTRVSFGVKQEETSTSLLAPLVKGFIRGTGFAEPNGSDGRRSAGKAQSLKVAEIKISHPDEEKCNDGNLNISLTG